MHWLSRSPNCHEPQPSRIKDLSVVTLPVVWATQKVKRRRPTLQSLLLSHSHAGALSSISLSRTHSRVHFRIVESSLAITPALINTLTLLSLSILYTCTYSLSSAREILWLPFLYVAPFLLPHVCHGALSCSLLLSSFSPSDSVLSKTAIFPKKEGRKREISNESARGSSLREANV